MSRQAVWAGSKLRIETPSRTGYDATVPGFVVDLFCGVGGLSYGFKKEGFTVRKGIDSDESCRYAFEQNVKSEFLPEDVSKLTGQQVAKWFPKHPGAVKILVGCAPCQPFSAYTSRYRKAKRRDSQWKLLEDFGRIVRDVKPDVVSMENVPRVERHRVFHRFVRDLKDLGYEVTRFIVRCEDYGVPQKRRRLVLLASKHGAISLLKPTHIRHKTVRDAIGHLPAIRAGATAKNDPIHKARGLSEINMKRLRSTKEGGSWKDWPEELRLRCHKKAKGRSFRSVYGRMRWDSPSPVITTQCLGIGNGRFGHPGQNRAISIREAALLQTFPAGFRFVADGQEVEGLALARHIGNAVPVRLGQVIARSIKLHLKKLKTTARSASR